MPRVLFLRHAARPPRPRPGVDRPDALTPTGEAQAQAVGVLLREHSLVPALAVHTATVRTTQTTRLALAGLDVPMRVVSGGPSRMSDLEHRAAEWARQVTGSGPVLLCAHHPTQGMLCRALGLRVRSSDRVLLEVELGDGPPRLVRLFTCAEDRTVWSAGDR